MDIETMPHTMYFTGNSDTVTKINHVPYQTIVHNDNGMFTAKLMNDTPIKIFIDNGATPSILPLCTYNKFPILHTYPKTESCKQLKTCFPANSLIPVFSSSYAGCFCLVCWFSCSFVSEACACFGEWLREVLCVETFVRVLRSSRVNLQ